MDLQCCERRDEDDFGWIDGTAMVAPGLLGLAVGLLLGELMHRGARRGVALALLGLGVAALVPLTVDGVIRKVNSPGTERGSRRRLRGIRDAGLATAGYEVHEHEFRDERRGG